MCVLHIEYVSLCTAVIHNTAENSSDNFPSYPGNDHSSDDIYWMGGGPRKKATVHSTVTI